MRSSSTRSAGVASTSPSEVTPTTRTRSRWLRARDVDEEIAPRLQEARDFPIYGTALAKELNPAPFSRDYAYTPFPLWLIKVLWNALGSYELALSVLMPVLLGVYVLGM